jgi:hypothetical protein
MLNDIARDNRVKERLEELKMLSLSDTASYVSGGKLENKEGWLGFGKKNSETEQQVTFPMEGKNIVTDLSKYIVVHAWTEYDRLTRHKRAWVYVKKDRKIHFFEDGIDRGVEKREDEKEILIFKQVMRMKEYEVIEQKINFEPRVTIEEIRKYPDGNRQTWLYSEKEWQVLSATV